MENEDTKYILAFGDSITRGYYNNGLKYHPYSNRLNILLKENNLNYKTIEKGINGEITKIMLERLKSYFECEISDYKYDYVIIYAGSNDMDYLEYEKIAFNIIELHKYIISKGAKSILITLPENKCDIIFDFYSNKRKQLNEMLLKLAKEIPEIVICDIDKSIKYKSMNKKERKKYWDDNEHYTPEGYDLLAELIFNTIKSIL